MDYRSPTIHSEKLLMAGSPFLHLLEVDRHIMTGVKHGYDNARHNNRRPRFADRRTTHPIFHQRKVTLAKVDAVTAVIAIEIRKAVVKAILVSAILFAMTAAILS